MFCSSCGKELSTGAIFCDGCGKATSEDALAITEGSVIETIMAKNPKTESTTKENVESGIPLTSTHAKLHSIVVAVLAKSPNIPLDVFEKVEIIREERYCVPAYLFSCTGTESFTYDVANIRQHKTAIDLGDRTRVETQNYEEWDNGKSSTTSVRKTIIASGNRGFEKQIRNLYGKLNTKKLVEIEELIFPTDVEKVKFDISLNIAYDEFAIPIVEKELKSKALESLSKQKFRDLQMGGANIQKDVMRIFLGMYRIIFKYGDKQHSVWVNGDGSNWWWNEGVPEDLQRKKETEEKKKLAEQKNKTADSMPTSNLGCLIFAIILFFIIGGIVSLIGLQAFISYGLDDSSIVFFVGLGFIIVAIICITRASSVSRKGKRLNAEREQALKEANEFQAEVDGFASEALSAEKQFREKKQALHGIYEDVSGDEKAF